MITLGDSVTKENLLRPLQESTGLGGVMNL